MRFELTTGRLSGATGYKPAALPLSYRGTEECTGKRYSKRLVNNSHGITLGCRLRRNKVRDDFIKWSVP